MIIWKHPDGRRIEVYEDRKVRSGLPWCEGGIDPNTRRERGWSPFGRDRWPVLYRAGMSLTDAEWYAAPGPDWIQVYE